MIFLNMLMDADTLTISTPSERSLPFLFKYNELLKKNARGIFNDVDIRGNRDLIFHEIRADGEYKISNNKSIKKIKDIFINLLINNINGSNIDQKTQTDTNKYQQTQKIPIIKDMIYQKKNKLSHYLNGCD